MASTNKKGGLVIGYNDVHPFCSVNITDRASVQQLLATVLDPLEPFFSPGKAKVKVPGATGTRFDQTASEVEGLCRPLWGLAFLLAGGGEYHGTEWWVQGFKSGTDPESPEYWGYPRDNDQRMVEMCPLGYALAAAPTFWQSMNEKERANMENWLGNSINEKNMPNTNWLWFRVFANLGLKKNGGKFSQERLDSDIKHLDTFHRGNGWSNDGPEGIHQMDYYSHSFAIQLIQLLYAKLAGEDDPERAHEFKKRAQQIALDLVHYYDDEGRAIPYGRSIGYRFAMVSFWGALAYADVELPAPLTWGMVKGIVLRHLRWWQTQPDMWSTSGTMTLGYSYPCMYLTENYNSPGSPYWANLAFMCLAVPASHPFWTSKEEFPFGGGGDAAPSFPKIKTLKHPGHIMTYTGNHCMLLSSGQACGYPMKGSHAKYGGFAYSSAFGYSVPTGLFTLEQYAPASQLALCDDGAGLHWRVRGKSEYAGLEYRGGSSSPVLVSVWKPGFIVNGGGGEGDQDEDVTVRTTLIPPHTENSSTTTPNWHIRAHRIDNSKGRRDVATAEGGFAIRNEDPRDTGRYLPLFSTSSSCSSATASGYEDGYGTSPKMIGNYDQDVPEGKAPGDQGAFVASPGRGWSGVRALEGKEEEEGGGEKRWAMIINADPNSNCMDSRTAIPTLRGLVKAGEVAWYVSAVYAKPVAAKGEGKENIGGREFREGWEKVPEIPGWLVEEMKKG